MTANRFRIFAALAFGAVLGGCANQAPTRSGFLSRYDGLAQTDSSGKVLATTPNPAALARFSEVYVEPVTVKFSGDVDPDAGRELARLTEQALRQELAARWTIVETPRPTAIRLRSALTAVHKSNPAINVALTVVAVPLFNGGLSGEAEFLSGKTRLGAITWAGEGVLNPIGYYSEYGHPRELTSEFAKAVAAQLSRHPSGSE